MNDAGQLLSIDMLVSFVVFAVLLFFLYQSWAGNADSWSKLWQRAEIENRAAGVADVLVHSPGYPLEWSAADVNVVGLANRPLVLDPQKMARLAALDYNTSREKLNIRAFDYALVVTSRQGQYDYNLGGAPAAFSNAASVERQVLIGGDDAVLRFSLYR